MLEGREAYAPLALWHHDTGERKQAWHKDVTIKMFCFFKKKGKYKSQ